MIIHIPVYIAIDPQSHHFAHLQANFVIRLDTDDDSKPIEYAKKYGTRALRFEADTGDVFATAFDTDGYRKLIARAKANPVDYCADETEGERLQEIADAARRTA